MLCGIVVFMAMWYLVPLSTFKITNAVCIVGTLSRCVLKMSESFDNLALMRQSIRDYCSNE
eukprot:c39915_g1_i1 orf=300-482(+)